MHLIFDFDGTITQKDTVGELANAGIEFQKRRNGDDLREIWAGVVNAYLDDYQAHRDDYKPGEGERSEVLDELRYLSASKAVEDVSLERVEKSGVFANMTTDDLRQAGRDAVEEGKIVVRDGFDELLAVAEGKGWTTAIISVNWSQAFIEGVLHPRKINVVANEVAPDGRIRGPRDISVEGRLTNGCEKKKVLKSLIPEEVEEEDCDEGQRRRAVVYFGDSTTDMECLIESGVVISDTDDSLLIRTLRRVGVEVPHVGDEQQSQAKVTWARNFAEVLKSGLLEI